MVEQKPGLDHQETTLQNRIVERISQLLQDYQLLQEHRWDQSQQFTEAFPPMLQYANIRERKPLQGIPRSSGGKANAQTPAVGGRPGQGTSARTRE